MEWRVDLRPSYSVLKVSLGPGEAVVAEPGAMVLMRGRVEIQTGTSGGLLPSLLRSLMGSESLFFNTYQAHGAAELWLAPALPGDIHYLPLNGDGYVIQDAAYLAHHGEVTLDVAWRGFRGWLTEGELVWLRARGRGGVWITAFGGIDAVEVGAGEAVIVDNFHFVAMDEGARYQIRPFGGLRSFLFGGEGLVVEVQGPTRLWLQSRHLASLASALLPIFRKRLRSK